MRRSRGDFTRYAKYFNRHASSGAVQMLRLIATGAVAGALSDLLVQHALVATLLGAASLIVYGAAAGILVISVPAMLSVLLLKATTRRVHIKHLLWLAFFSTLLYGFFFVLGAVSFALSNSYALAYAVLILGDAAVYGYWIFMGKFVMARNKSAPVIAVIQPVLNILFYLPLGGYLIGITAPAGAVLIKLYVGMLVFLLVSYLSLYMLDRPMKKAFNMSSVKLFTVMLGQWLYNINIEPSFMGGESGGVARNVRVDILALRGRSGYKAVFVSPDIHYGPFMNVGGSVAPEHIGTLIVNDYEAAPFVLHSAVNLNDNPISTAQVYRMANEIDAMLRGVKASEFQPAFGNVSIGVSGPCRAISMSFGDSCLLTLSKAPLVTEDIDHGVGEGFRRAARASGFDAILIDAHNSRFESASAKELEGIHKGSRYVSLYEKAIARALGDKGRHRLRAGAAHQRMAPLLDRPKDLGSGYTSVCVFEYGKKRFGLVYIDANNIIPGFRKGVLDALEKKYGFSFELCTTDTHSVNSIALNASNALGRYTRISEALPIIDSLVGLSLSDMEPVRYVRKTLIVDNFRVWGAGTEEELNRVSKEMTRAVKRTVPFIIAAGFIAAAWLIYIV